jgi:hypothetical protein
VADVRKGEGKVIAWGTEYSDYVEYVVVQEVVNDGDGWAELSAFNSDYTLLDSDGGIITTGSFTYALPRYLGPGETGYLVEYSVDDSGTPADRFATVEAEGRYDEVAGAKYTAEVTDVTWRHDEFSGGLTATGFLTASKAMDSAAVIVMCVGEGGEVLGVTSTNLVQNITARERKAFETIQNTPPLDPSQCVETRGYVDDFGF